MTQLLSCYQNKCVHLKGGEKMKKALGLIIMATALFLIVTPFVNSEDNYVRVMKDPGGGGR